MKKKIFCKKLCGLVIAGAVMLSMAGCSGKNEPTTAATEAITTEEGTTESTSTESTTTEEGMSDDSSDGNENQGAKDAISSAMIKVFRDEISSGDIVAVANAMAPESVSGIDCGVMECQEGYLNGFSGDVKGFNKGVCISPWIGSIPMICYIFETDDTETLKASLLELADPNWNICTEANQPIVEVNGNYVFFIMTPVEADE